VRYCQWVAKGIYQALLEKIAQTPDMKWLMVDATQRISALIQAASRHKKIGLERLSNNMAHAAFGKLRQKQNVKAFCTFTHLRVEIIAFHQIV